MLEPDLKAAAAAAEVARGVVERCATALGDIDEHQAVAYDLAHAAAAVEIARSVLDYGALGDVEARMACAYVADVVHDVATRFLAREAAWGSVAGALDAAMPFLRACRDPKFLATLAEEEGP